MKWKRLLLWMLYHGKEKSVNIRNNSLRDNQILPSFDIELLFAFAGDNDQLKKDIMEFDQEEYDKVLDEFHKKARLVFDGNASEKLTGKIVNFIDEEK